jgi:hypothetical protein
MLACIEGALEFEEKMDYMVTEDVLMATAEDCEIARDSCNELLEDIVEIPLGKGPNYYGLGQHMRRGLP